MVEQRYQAVLAVIADGRALRYLDGDPHPADDVLRRRMVSSLGPPEDATCPSRADHDRRGPNGAGALDIAHQAPSRFTVARPV